MKNPYNIDNQPELFDAWALGEESPSSLKNPFDVKTEPEVAKAFELGRQGNKNKAVKASNFNSGASSTAEHTQVTPQEIKQALNEPPGPVNLALISLDKLCAEIVKRFKEYEEFKDKYAKVFK